MIKRRKSIPELIDGILGGGSASAAPDAADGADEAAGAHDAAEAEGKTESAHLARLGRAFLNRLTIPEGMGEEEAAERIIAMWNAAPSDMPEGKAEGAGAFDEKDAGEGFAYPAYPDYPDDPDHPGEIERLMQAHGAAAAYRPEQGAARESARAPRLPSPLRGGLFEAPRADYESMSAEQFHRLKKQLERASMDGRKIRL